MKKYIKVYDNVLPEEHCKTLIDKFELNKDQQVSTDLENHRHFTEININQHVDWKSMVDGLYTTLRPYVERYKKDCNIKDKQWPDKFGFEQIRFKRYLPNDKDEFKEHVDVGDYASARRFLVFFLFYFITYCTVNKLASDSDSLNVSEFKHNVSNCRLCTLVLV